MGGLHMTLHSASSDELTEICNTLYDRCLLAELGIKGFHPQVNNT